MIEVRDTRKAAAARKRARRQAKLDPVWLAMVHTLGCCVCERQPIEAHHWPSKSKSGWSDWNVVPLCAEHHRGKFGYHTLGERQFEEMHGSLGEMIRETKERLGFEAYMVRRG